MGHMQPEFLLFFQNSILLQPRHLSSAWPYGESDAVSGSLRFLLGSVGQAPARSAEAAQAVALALARGGTSHVQNMDGSGGHDAE